MIYRLEIENFYSILEAQAIDLRVTDKVQDDGGRFAPVHPKSSERVPKVVSLFGSNAAGKTTVLRALAFATWFAKDSFQLTPEAHLPFSYFNSRAGQGRPTRLRLSFGGPTILRKPPVGEQVTAFGTYTYEIVLSHSPTAPSIVERELLTHRPDGARKSARVFERDSKGKVTGSKTFQVTRLGPIAEKIRANASTISTLAQFEHAEAVTLRDAARTVFTNILLFKQDASDAQLIEAYSTLPELMAGLNAEISRIDLGMRKMEVNTENPRGRYLQFQHDGLEAPIPWHFESHGTQSFIRSFPLLFRALEEHGLAVIDELDASIHPHVLLEVTRWFQSSSRNSGNAQLWMTAQNASLLEELAKEEVFLCEKDELGRTQVYGLQDIKAVRRADNFYRKYMSGAYGAIPNIG